MTSIASPTPAGEMVVNHLCEIADQVKIIKRWHENSGATPEEAKAALNELRSLIGTELAAVWFSDDWTGDLDKYISAEASYEAAKVQNQLHDAYEQQYYNSTRGVA